MPPRKIEKICNYCNKKYIGVPKSKFCSPKCFYQNTKKEKAIYKLCKYCNKSFKILYSSQKFCSKECFYSSPKPKGQVISTRIEKECKYCNKIFLVMPSENNKIFCNKKCFHLFQNRNKKKNVICDICSKEFYKRPAKIKRSKNYCSVECTNKGFKLSETIEEVCSQCNKTFKRKRRHRPKNKELRFCSVTCANKYNGKFHQKENHHNYNPNLTDKERIYKRDTWDNIKWRNSIFKRDNYSCQICKKKGGTLNAHHIENYSSSKEKRFDINNGITLCKICHKKFHDTFGYRNNNKKQLKKFIKEYDIIK